MRSTRWVMRLAGLSLVVACGGSDASSPTPAFPALDGAWSIQGTFNDFAANVASFSGTVTFDQPSRNQPEITATASVTVVISGSSSTLTVISAPAITTAGLLTFNLNVPNAASTWAFTGSVSGTAANGTHVLAGSGSSFPGVWQATHP